MMKKKIIALLLSTLCPLVSCTDGGSYGTPDDTLNNADIKQKSDAYTRNQRKLIPVVEKIGKSIMGDNPSDIANNTALFFEGHKIGELDILKPDERKAYIERSTEIIKNADELRPRLIKLMLDAIDNETILHNFRKDALKDIEQTNVAPRSLAALIGITGMAIAAYSAYKSTAAAIDHTQQIVTESINRSPEARKAIIRMLKDRGADIRENSGNDQLHEAFKNLSHSKRMSLTKELKDWTHAAIASDNKDSTVLVRELERDKEHFSEASNMLGRVAVEATVNGGTTLTGGAGEFVNTAVGGSSGKLYGAATDLVLQISQKDPISVTQKYSVVTVQSKAIPAKHFYPETSSVSPEQAKEKLNAFVKGGKNADDFLESEIDDAAKALLVEHKKNINLGNDLPYAYDSVVITEAQIVPPGKHQNLNHTATLKLPIPRFPDKGIDRKITVLTEGFMPFEVDMNASLAPENFTVNVELVPLSGTISASAKALGDNRFEITAQLTHIKNPVPVSVEATQAVLSGERKITSDRQAKWIITLTGDSRVTVKRHDNGESYSFSVRIGEKPAPGPDNPGSDEPSTKCDMSIFKGTLSGEAEHSNSETEFQVSGTMTFTLKTNTFDLNYTRKRFCPGKPMPCNNTPKTMTLSGRIIPKEVEWQGGKTTCDYDFEFLPTKASDPLLLIDIPKYYAPQFVKGFDYKDYQDGDPFLFPVKYGLMTLWGDWFKIKVSYP